MLGVLRLLDRLPDARWRPTPRWASGCCCAAIAALGLGLLTSAAVGNVAQATLALPMLCFPAVLFSGAILPVHLMAGAGAALSAAMPTRWAFEAIGHDLGARAILADGGSPLGPPLLDVVRRRRHRSPPAPTGWSSPCSPSSSSSPPGS